nr:hypothetical transcript [Hymenolepis microstoma]
MNPSISNGFVIFSNKTEAQNALSAPVHSVNGCFFKVIPSRQIPKTEKESSTAMSESEVSLKPSQSSLSQSASTQSLQQTDIGSTVSQLPPHSSLSRDTPTASSRRILIHPSSSVPESAFPSIEVIRDHFEQFGKVVQVVRCKKPQRAYVEFESSSERMKAAEEQELYLENRKFFVVTSFRSEFKPEDGMELWNSEGTSITQI